MYKIFALHFGVLLSGGLWHHDGIIFSLCTGETLLRFLLYWFHCVSSSKLLKMGSAASKSGTDYKDNGTDDKRARLGKVTLFQM
jgi:hypothetical protein